MNRPQPSSFPPRLPRLEPKIPPQAWFAVSAVFHYLGPAFAVLLFPAVGVLGVAWFRIASAALVFAPITRPLRLFARIDRQERLLTRWHGRLSRADELFVSISHSRGFPSAWLPRLSLSAQSGWRCMACEPRATG